MQCKTDWAGLAETFSYAALGVLNSLVMSNDSDPLMFLYLFLILAVCSLFALVVTASVSDPALDGTKDPGMEATKDPGLDATNDPGLEASKEEIRMRQTCDIESDEINNNSES